MSQLPLEVSVQEVADLEASDPSWVLVDVREPSEYEIASIGNAVLLPMSNWADHGEELEEMRDKRIIVHCHHGGRSLRVTEWLRENGYEAQNMTGGIDAWSQHIDQNVPRY